MPCNLNTWPIARGLLQEFVLETRVRFRGGSWQPSGRSISDYQNHPRHSLK
jgi:hypothetical protein